MPNKDTYRTISNPSEEILFKEKKSKFYGYAFPISSVEEVKPIIDSLKKRHHTANHVCYAWQLGTKELRYRANDDGEPNNSAGIPIYGQIQSYQVTNVLIAVARVFGGTKLGVGGLISAYRTAAQLSLDSADIIEETIKESLNIAFDYPDMDKVMRLIKQQQLEVLEQKLEIQCEMVVAVPLSKLSFVISNFDSLVNVIVKKTTV